MKIKNIEICLSICLLCGTVSAADAITASEAPFDMPPVTIWSAPDRDFSITDFGAVPGDDFKNTEAFAKAIAACADAGGGRVMVPGGDWLTGGIRLRSNVELHLEDGAKIVFTDDPHDYLPAVETTWEGLLCLNYAPLVYAYGCTNVAVSGHGTLAPRMGQWRRWFNRPPEHMAATEFLYHAMSTNAPVASRDMTAFKGANMRPYLMQFHLCENVRLEDFSIRESPIWCIHLFRSRSVYVRGVDVNAHGHNNDGIDVEMTKNVIIENCRFNQGDDAIVIKSGRNQDAWRLNEPTENVVVRNCEVADGHVLLGIGSEMSGGVRNVLMHDCRMVGNALNVFYMKTNERRGGFIENIYMKDCSVEAIGKKPPMSVVGIETDVMYQWRNLPTYEAKITRIRNISAENVKVNRANHLLMVYGDARDEVDGVTLKNVSCDSIGKERLVVVNARNVTIDGEAIPSRTGAAPKR